MENAKGKTLRKKRIFYFPYSNYSQFFILKSLFYIWSIFYYRDDETYLKRLLIDHLILFKQYPSKNCLKL